MSNKKRGSNMKQMKWLAGSMVLALGISAASPAQVRPGSGSAKVSSDQQKQQLLADDTGGNDSDAAPILYCRIHYGI